MLTIRLTRVGKPKHALYRFIVSEKARDPWGKALENLGTYNPRTSPATIEIDGERVSYWISKGAQCSETAWNLLVEHGTVKGEKRKLTTISNKRKEKMAKKAEQPAA